MAVIDVVSAILEDHRVIERTLGNMVQALPRLGCDAGAGVLLEQSIAFLKHFAEDYHHQKEETEWFPMLRESGLPEIARMLQEDHRSGLRQIEALERYLPAALSGDHTALEFVRREGSHYVALTREHIRQEDDVIQRLKEEMGLLAPGVIESLQGRNAPCQSADEPSSGRRPPER